MGKRGGQAAAPRRRAKRARQGTLTECGKVVVLDDVRRLAAGVRDATDALIRLSLPRPSAAIPADSDAEATTAAQATTAGEATTASGEDLAQARRFEERNLQQWLERLDGMFISLETLEVSDVGKVVNRVAKMQSAALPESIKALAAQMVSKWRATALQGSRQRRVRSKMEREGNVPVLRRS